MDTYAWPSKSAGVMMTQADGFVCVSWWRDKDDAVPPHTGSYQYEWFDTAEAAYDSHREYEAGEYRRATAIGVFACKGGMPIGGRIL